MLKMKSQDKCFESANPQHFQNIQLNTNESAGRASTCHVGSAESVTNAHYSALCGAPHKAEYQPVHYGLFIDTEDICHVIFVLLLNTSKRTSGGLSILCSG